MQTQSNNLILSLATAYQDPFPQGMGGGGGGGGAYKLEETEYTLN